MVFQKVNSNLKDNISFYLQVISLPAPYNTKCENKKLPGATVYSKPLCYKACQDLYVTKKCGCLAPNIPSKNLYDCLNL